MRPVLDLMRAGRGYMLGRFLGLVGHLSQINGPTDFHRHISEKPEAAVKRASLVLNFELEKIKANDPERAVVIRRRMLSIVESLRSADMTAPLSFAEQLISGERRPRTRRDHLTSRTEAPRASRADLPNS